MFKISKITGSKRTSPRSFSSNLKFSNLKIKSMQFNRRFSISKSLPQINNSFSFQPKSLSFAKQSFLLSFAKQSSLLSFKQNLSSFSNVRALSISRPLRLPEMSPGLWDPREWSEEETGFSGVEAVFNEVVSEMGMDKKLFEMYGVRRRYRVTEGQKKFAKRSGLRKRRWRSEMAKRIEPIVNTFGYPDQNVSYDNLGPPPIIYHPPYRTPKRTLAEWGDNYFL